MTSIGGGYTAAQRRDQWVPGAGEAAPGDSSATAPDSSAPLPSVSAAPAPVARPELQVAPSAGQPAAAPDLQVKPATNYAVLGKAQTRQATYLEIAERLEPLIQAQAAEISRVMEAKGLKPDEVEALLDIDITGEQKIVCSFCGRPNCNYKPTTYRADNPERNLLTDGLVVFMEAAEKAGIRWGVIAYDDQDVVPIRELASAGAGRSDREETRRRFEDFAGRHDNPEITRAWLDKMLAKWTPEDRVRPQVGQADDTTAFRVAETMFGRSEQANPIQCLTMSKALPPLSSLALEEMSMKSRGVRVNGLAVGQEAELVAQNFLSDTDIAHDPHEFKEKVGHRIAAALDQD